MDDQLYQAIVYRNPRDMPGVRFCVRLWRIAKKLEPSGEVTPFETVAGARWYIRLRWPQLDHQMFRQLDDDPAIVEVWL